MEEDEWEKFSIKSSIFPKEKRTEAGKRNEKNNSVIIKSWKGGTAQNTTLASKSTTALEYGQDVCTGFSCASHRHHDQWAK